MSPVYHRLTTSPPSFPLSESHEEAQARPLYTVLSPYQPSSSQDQRVDDGGPSLAKTESSSMAARVGGSSDSNFLAVGDRDGWCRDNYGMGWMSSKIRFIQKMKTNNDTNHHTGPTTNDSKTIRNVISSNDRADVTMNGGGGRGGNCATRVCSNCNTTTTPLWRSGPKGPKSLCNACGIRQRKARRAMEESAATARGFDSSSSSMTSRISSSKVQNKEKKSRGAGHYVLGPTCKKTTKTSGGGGDNLFGDFSVWRGAFPPDVTEAAILLLDLSCGFTHT